MINILADLINLQILRTVSMTYDCNDDSYEKKTQYGNNLRDVIGSFHIIIEAFEEYSATVPVNQKILAVFTHSESHLRTFFLSWQPVLLDCFLFNYSVVKLHTLISISLLIDA